MTLTDAICTVFPNADSVHGTVVVPWADGYMVADREGDTFRLGIYDVEGWTEGESWLAMADFPIPSNLPEGDDAEAFALAALVSVVDFLTDEQPEETDWSAWAAHWVDEILTDLRAEEVERG